MAYPYIGIARHFHVAFDIRVLDQNLSSEAMETSLVKPVYNCNCFFFVHSGIEKCLLENDHVCPLCQTEDVAPASIVINKHLRQV